MNLKIDSRLIDDPRPIVAVDIDGVLNYCGMRPRRYNLKKTYVRPYEILHKHDVLEILRPLIEADRAGDVQLVWGTMWEDSAPGVFASRVLRGVGSDWPVIYFTTQTNGYRLNNQERHALQVELERESYGVYFKTPAMLEFAQRTGRRVVWLDDGVTEFDRDFLVGSGITAITVDEDTALTREHVTDALIAAEKLATVTA